MKNKKTILGALITIIILSVIANAQEGTSTKTSENDSRARAIEIVEKYRSATGIDKVLPNIKLLSIKFDRSWSLMAENSEVYTTIKETQNLSSDNAMLTESTNSSGNVPYKQIEIWDGTTYYSKRTELGKADAERRVELGSKDLRRKSNDLRNIYWKTFQVFFPITFETKSYKQFEFRHVGVAKSPEGKIADVLQVDRGNGLKYQFLFDRETHLLLLWITFRKDKDGKDEQFSRHFSDYKKFSDLLIAHKIETKGVDLPMTFEVTDFTATTNSKSEVFDIPEK